MSKAILVMDMPEKCSECMFMYEFGGIKKCSLLNCMRLPCYINRKDECLNNRYKFCPLKQVPDRLSINNRLPKCDTDNNYEIGWNECLDQILD